MSSKRSLESKHDSDSNKKLKGHSLDHSYTNLQDNPYLQQEKPKSGRGLDVELHPLLRNFNDNSNSNNNNNNNNSSSSNSLVSSKNPLRLLQNKWFDPAAYNPYVSNSSSLPLHKPRPLRFVPKGKYVAKAAKLREKLQVEEEERQIQDELLKQGLLPDKVLNEELYTPKYPPLIEWWDRSYLRDNNYSKINDESRLLLESEEQPITYYIQHPPMLQAIWESKTSDLNDLKPMFLTAKERKRMRKNDRQIRHKEKQDRIKLGLDPPPPPKVKLSNLMNVLTNEAIRDPTAVEKKVRQQVEERLQKHLAENEARKLTKEEKHAKLFVKQEKDLAQGLHTAVFRILKLDNPKDMFKIDKNAQQDNLFGICLKNPKFNLVIVEGGEKALKHYKKLMMHRIKWDENDPNNECRLLWDATIEELHFGKWSIMHSRDDEEALKVLRKFGLESYWTLAHTDEEKNKNE